MATHNLGFGVGLRAPHYQHFLQQRPKSVAWLEIITDNYLNAHNGYWQMLADLRRDYPMVMHGVSLSIGSTDSLDVSYLKAVRRLADHLDVAWISDHLCYTGINREFTHDLLPIPYTEEALRHLIPRIHQTQELLQRPIALENASSYIEWRNSTLSESEFLGALHAATDCKVLLDINNVYVSSFNHQWDAKHYIRSIPSDAIIQYHLAGHTDNHDHLIDTHDAPVCAAVWDLYKYTLEVHGPRSTLVEWDAKIPEFTTLEHELKKAQSISHE
jgi:uncharacterized protein